MARPVAKSTFRPFAPIAVTEIPARLPAPARAGASSSRAPIASATARIRMGPPRATGGQYGGRSRPVNRERPDSLLFLLADGLSVVPRALHELRIACEQASELFARQDPADAEPQVDDRP